MNNFADFCYYFNNANNNNSYFADISAYKDMYNAYSSFLVARKYNIDDIKRYRMNTLIDYFIQINKLSDSYREDIRKYYLNHIKDDFNSTLNPPKCPFYEAEMLRKQEEEQQRIEDENDEVKEHYRQLECKYKYLADLVYRLNHPEEFEDQLQDYREYDDNISTSDSNETYDEYSCDEYDDYYNTHGDYHEDDDQYMSDDDYYY